MCYQHHNQDIYLYGMCARCHLDTIDWVALDWALGHHRSTSFPTN